MVDFGQCARIVHSCAAAALELAGLWIRYRGEVWNAVDSAARYIAGLHTSQWLARFGSAKKKKRQPRQPLAFFEARFQLY